MKDMSSDATAEKRLMAAVVAQAVKDACLLPIERRRRGKTEMALRSDAITAMAFLFEKSMPGLDAYAIWLDFDTDRFRERLIDACDSNRRDPMFSDQQRRAFRHNYRIFMSMTKHERTGSYEIEDEEE